MRLKSGENLAESDSFMDEPPVDSTYGLQEDTIISFQNYPAINDEDSLKSDLINSLRRQGFFINEKGKLDIETQTNDKRREIQVIAKNDILRSRKNFILQQSKLVRKYAVNGTGINPSKISLEIRQVISGTEDELLFRWWNLTWWSMPYQRPYGRQMRFIIWDTFHQAPFGIISLQSPILRQAVRDKYLKIPKADLDYWVNRSMYAQRVGALPPYNELLGGKMVALSLVCNEIKDAYRLKYKDCKTIMKSRHIESDLLFITTTSAFGKSSLYNRLKIKNDSIAQKLGSTEGYGSFQITENLYKRILAYLENKGENIVRGYGGGPSKKLKLIQLACRNLDIIDYSYHGIKREYYLFPLVFNLEKVIQNQEQPKWKNHEFTNLVAYWKDRWFTKRAENVNIYNNFNFDDYIDNVHKLINEGGTND